MRIMMTHYGPMEGDGYRLRMEQTDGEFPIRLYKNPDKRYAVQYGKQLDYDLSYTEAAHKLGEATMHLLQCEGKLD